MIQMIKNLFSGSEEVNYKLLMLEGADIVDVRSKAEYDTGHIKGSINIPLQNIYTNTHKLNKNKHVITCCASGMRSASAKNILFSEGFTKVYNGGGWTSLNKKIS